MQTLLYTSLALAPIFTIILFIYFKDKYKKEPFRLLFYCFIGGIISIIPPIIIENAVEFIGLEKSDNWVITAIYAIGVVGFIEELSKFFVLRIIVYKNAEFNEPFDGIVYAVLVSMGFAAVENVFYVFNSTTPGITALIRALTAVPAHAVFAILMGFYIGMARFTFKRRRLRYLLQGIFVAVLFHGLYDFFLFQKESIYLSIMALVVLSLAVFLSLRAIKIRQRMSPFKKQLSKHKKLSDTLTKEEMAMKKLRIFKNIAKSKLEKRKSKQGNKPSQEEF
jgi:protease PrsW